MIPQFICISNDWIRIIFIDKFRYFSRKNHCFLIISQLKDHKLAGSMWFKNRISPSSFCWVYIKSYLHSWMFEQLIIEIMYLFSLIQVLGISISISHVSHWFDEFSVEIHDVFTGVYYNDGLCNHKRDRD